MMQPTAFTFHKARLMKAYDSCSHLLTAGGSSLDGERGGYGHSIEF